MYTFKSVCRLLDNYLVYRLEPQCSGCYTGIYYKHDPDHAPSGSRKRYVTPESNILDGVIDLDNAIDSLGYKGRWHKHVLTIEDETPSDSLTPIQKHISNYITGQSSRIYPNIPYILMSRLNSSQLPKQRRGYTA